MNIEVRVKRQKGDETQGNTDYKRLKKITEEEIQNNAKEDEDAPILKDEDLLKFKRVNAKRD